jgi:magnesium transporter
VLKRLGAETVKEITARLAYDQQTAGRIMTNLYIALPAEVSSGEALARIQHQLREEHIDPDTHMSDIYVTDPHDTLLGVVSLKQLLSALPDSPLGNIMSEPKPTVSPEESQGAVARIIADYDVSAIAVIDPETSCLQGIITVDDVLDVIEKAHTEEVLKLAGTEDDDTVSASFLVSLRSRMPWLFASWVGGLFGVVLLDHFSDALQHTVMLASFMPVVFGMAGNVGSQTSTITVRGLATGELNPRRILPRLRKELGVGLCLGAAFGVLLGLAAALLYGQFTLSLIVGCSIVATMTLAATVGAVLPLVFKRLGFDPAVASGPLVTTSTDLFSITVYFSIARILLHVL